MNPVGSLIKNDLNKRRIFGGSLFDTIKTLSIAKGGQGGDGWGDKLVVGVDDEPCHSIS